MENKRIRNNVNVCNAICYAKNSFYSFPNLTKNRKIRSEAGLIQAIKGYLAEGKTVSEITTAVNRLGVVCHAVGIELLIQKHKLN